MALRPWRGEIVFENVETGDGRIMAPDSLAVAPLPLPLAFLRDGDQHIDLTEMAPQIGTIETAVRNERGAFDATGFIDDANPDGAEAIRRMETESAPLGARHPISIDGDDWAVQVIIRDPEILDMLEGDDDFSAGQAFTVSGNSTIHLRAGESLVRNLMVSDALRSTHAAAGDPDPGNDGGEDGVVMFEDRAEWVLERFTSLRIRGATLCAVAAFDGAAIELAGAAVESEAPVVAAPGISAPALPSDPYPPLPFPAAPPRDWFYMPEPEAGSDLLVEQPDGSWAVPFTISDDGYWFGHLATASGPHRGYSSHVTAPRSPSGYAEFQGRGGHVVCDDGTDVPTGCLVVGGDHAPLSMNLEQARDFYANSTVGFADGRVVDGVYGPWGCGALRPGLNAADLRVLRALSPSGDWRSAQGGPLEMLTALMVNVPGFPVTRESMAAAALVASCGPGGCGPADARDMPAIHYDGRVTALVAAGMVVRCSDCAERARTASARNGFETDVRSFMRLMDARTRHLTPAALEALAARLRPA